LFAEASLNSVAYIITGILMLFALVWFSQWLWNITIPQVFNLEIISYWEALRILIIAGILFGSFNPILA